MKKSLRTWEIFFSNLLGLLMPCPFTSPKIFCACQYFLSQSKNLTALMPCPSMWPKLFWLVQNGFGLTKLIWTWPLLFGLDQNEMVTTKMNLSGPNCDSFSHCLDLDLNNLLTRRKFWRIPGMLGNYAIPKWKEFLKLHEPILRKSYLSTFIYIN